MTESRYEEFIHETHRYLMAQQERCKDKYRMGKYERYDFDQQTGEFVFSHRGVPKLVADFQVVGSISTKSNTWLWSWANSSILEGVKKDIYRVRQFGEENGLKQLVEEKWTADEADGWTMTSISAQILAAKGAYRCPTGNGFLFVIFTDIRKVHQA